MAYEHTEVPVARSQEALRRLIMGHKGFGWAAVSQRDPQGKEPAEEGFEAKVVIGGSPCVVRIKAKLRRAHDPEQEERRVWRVLYYHMKGIFESADSGVMEFREMMLPYVVLPDGTTVAEKILPRVALIMAGKVDRLLPERTD